MRLSEFTKTGKIVALFDFKFLLNGFDRLFLIILCLASIFRGDNIVNFVNMSKI